jgi:hypothetical protein
MGGWKNGITVLGVWEKGLAEMLSYDVGCRSREAARAAIDQMNWEFIGTRRVRCGWV